MAERTQVRTSYDMALWPAMDHRLKEAVGRPSDFSGSNFIGRDHGWVCANEFEVERTKRAIKSVGLVPRTTPEPELNA